MTNEIWRDVVGFEGRYAVSDLGRVKSLRTGLCLRGSEAGAGYRAVNLGHSLRRYVHHLVLEAFVGPRPEGTQIRHLDGDKTNNSVANLAYGTRGENNRDRKWHRPATNQKLSVAQVREIKSALGRGGSVTALARTYSVSTTNIKDIRRGAIHADV